jgi:hypothetical protein
MTQVLWLLPRLHLLLSDQCPSMISAKAFSLEHMCLPDAEDAVVDCEPQSVFHSIIPVYVIFELLDLLEYD